MSLIADLSNNNPEPDWHALAGSVVGVWLKATEGVQYRDGPDAGRVGHARAAGLRVGWYHFARPDRNSATAEAEFFASYVRQHGGIQRRDLRPALDLEHDHELTDGQAFRWIVEWNQAVKRLTGTAPVFYSYSAYIDALNLPRPVGSALWLANYGPNDGERHAVSPPHPWRKVSCHQFTSRGRLPGCGFPVDVSYAPKMRPLLAHPLTGAK